MKLAKYFTRDKRDNGESFVKLADNRPQWLYDAVYDAHAGKLPDDWVFEQCFAACEAIDAGAFGVLDVEDAIHEYCEAQVDVYTRELFTWAAEFCLSGLYADAEAEAKDLGEADDTAQRIASIQYCAIERITRTMIEAWEENSGEAEESTE